MKEQIRFRGMVIVLAIMMIVIGGFVWFVNTSQADWIPSGIIATPAITTGTNTLIHADGLFTSESQILYVFFGIGNQADVNQVPTDVYWRWTLLTTRTQTLADGTTLALYRQPCTDYVEVWNRTTWTIYVAPNVGLQPMYGGERINWQETTPTLDKTMCYTVLGPYGGGNLPVAVRWTKENDPGAFAPFGKIWNVGVIIEDDGTYVSATELQSEFTSAGSQFVIKGQ